jgi:tetratricopeptide (TPR) repeat protein
VLHFFRAVFVLFALLACVDAGAQSVTPRTFDAMQRVQKLMEDERYEEAREILEAHAVRVERNDYDFALTSQYLAHVSMMLDDQDRAREALAAALAREGVPPDARAELSLFYGTVLMSEEEHALALEALEEWYAAARVKLPGQIFSLAYANYMNGKLQRAGELVELAIEGGQLPGMQTQEAWYQLYYRVLFDQKRYDEAEVVLKEMIGRVPANPTYWRMLAGHYLALEEGTEGLAALMIAYMNDMLESSADLSQIVSLFGYVEAPEKGARLLATWLEDGRIEKNPESLKRLGGLWLASRERDNALAVLREAAELEPDSRTFEQLGGIYFEEEQWSDAYAAYRQALDQGDVEEPALINLLAGISAYRAGENELARRPLEIAAEDAELRRQAESILRELH